MITDTECVYVGAGGDPGARPHGQPLRGDHHWSEAYPHSCSLLPAKQSSVRGQEFHDPLTHFSPAKPGEAREQELYILL